MTEECETADDGDSQAEATKTTIRSMNEAHVEHVNKPFSHHMPLYSTQLIYIQSFIQTRTK